MVSMVILLTVISIGILLWTNVVKGIGKFQSDSELYYTYVNLTNLIDQDLNSAVSVYLTGRILKLSNDIAENTYTFYSDSVIRETGNATTTFIIKSNSLELHYLHESDLVNGMFIEFSVNGKPLPFHAYKPTRGRFQLNTMFENGN
jgi:hypothetical protein